MQSIPQALPPKQQKESDVVYSEEELESSISISDSASYFQKAQDFKQLVKTLRVTYLGLTPRSKTDEKGNVFVEYVRDKSKITGINQEGVEANIRFLETRLGQHAVLTSWKEPRMMDVLRDDMFAWLDMMMINYDNFKLTEATAIELRALINDELEMIYRRAVNDQERQNMKPESKEVVNAARRLLGLDQQKDYPPEYRQEQHKDSLRPPGY